jgi:hypothetical protein
MHPNNISMVQVLATFADMQKTGQLHMRQCNGLISIQEDLPSYQTFEQFVKKEVDDLLSKRGPRTNLPLRWATFSPSAISLAKARDY